jgi:hypothetical protein
MGENLAAITLEEAIPESETMLAERSQEHELDGIEIWDGAHLYTSPDSERDVHGCHAPTLPVSGGGSAAD